MKFRNILTSRTKLINVIQENKLYFARNIIQILHVTITKFLLNFPLKKLLNCKLD